MFEGPDADYPWVEARDERFTLALILDVCEVLARHGYLAPTGATLVDLTTGIYRALHPSPYRCRRQPPSPDRPPQPPSQAETVVSEIRDCSPKQ